METMGKKRANLIVFFRKSRGRGQTPVFRYRGGAGFLWAFKNFKEKNKKAVQFKKNPKFGFIWLQNRRKQRVVTFTGGRGGGRSERKRFLGGPKKFVAFFKSRGGKLVGPKNKATQKTGRNNKKINRRDGILI